MKKMMSRLPVSRQRPDLGHWAFWIVPFVIYLLHAMAFRDWLIDDAGISFAYARNLALGYGLVSQPGLPPVEAYSNFLWVLLLTPFFVLRIFEPFLTLKALSGVLVLASYGLIYKTFAHRFRSPLAMSVILTLLGLNTAFVVWTTSGLENPLYVLLVCLMLAMMMRSLEPEARSSWRLAGLALLAIGLALTRPDGIFFAIAYPMTLLIWSLAASGPARRWRAAARDLLVYAAVFGLIYGAFLMFRLSYFGELLPNTYYAKGGPSAYEVVSLLTLQPAMVTKALGLVASVAGRGLAGLALLAVLVGTCFVVFTGRFRAYHLVVAVLLLCAAGIYLLLPDDGMGEYRFGTPFVVLFYLFGGLLAHAAWDSWRAPDKLKTVVTVGVVVVLLAGSTFLFSRRSARFAAHPPIPFSDIVAEYGRRYDEYAAALGIPPAQASVLLPDLGGTLYASQVRIYDLGMLADKTIARTLMRDQRAFYDYVFEEIRPTFIHVHDVWSYLARLDDDPRFRRDYVPLYEYPDAWAKQRHGLTVYAGDYVHRDVLNDGNRAALAELQARWAQRGALNKALYLRVAGSFAEAEQVYRAAVAAATADDLRQAMRDVNAFLTIYPADPQGLWLRDRLQAELARR